MIAVRVVLLVALALMSEGVFECYFDYDQKCFAGLPTNSLVLLNETSDEPRLPASDVTAIETYNDQGECYFPFQVNAFEMFFCEQTDPALPATCPTFNSTGPRINCSEGSYGYERFEADETGSRTHKLELARPLESGEHCIRFQYYLSDGNSDASIEVVVEDEFDNSNATILTASERLANRWHEIRADFTLSNANPTIYFTFERGTSPDSLPFYIAIDEIYIVDFECGPMNTTTPISTTTISSSSATTPSTTSTSSATSTITTTGSTLSPSSTTLSTSSTSTTTGTPPSTTLPTTTTTTTQSTTSSTTTTATSTSTVTTRSSSTSVTPAPTTTTTTPTSGGSLLTTRVQSSIVSLIALFVVLSK